ncbi:MAG: hypothetical protein WBW84_15705 [Acidobacteriaceae bacterium]
MKEKMARLFAVAILALLIPRGGSGQASSFGASTPYQVMAPLGQYLMPDKDDEIALARSATPVSISSEAEVMVLGHNGYETVVRGTNGFLCVVERSWGAGTENPEFWNPRVRSPVCFNPPAARSMAPVYLMKSKLVLAGKSKAQIVQAVDSAFETKELPALEPGAMAYMMSRQQYLSDAAQRWHPHLMFFVPGDAAKSWGGNLPGSPVIAANDPEEGATIFLVWVGAWSDGTPAPRSDNDH